MNKFSCFSFSRILIIYLSKLRDNRGKIILNSIVEKVRGKRIVFPAKNRKK